MSSQGMTMMNQRVPSNQRKRNSTWDTISPFAVMVTVTMMLIQQHNAVGFQTSSFLSQPIITQQHAMKTSTSSSSVVVVSNTKMFSSRNNNNDRGGEGFGESKKSSLSSTATTKKSSSSSSFSTPAGDFAYQEMLVFFNSMQKQGASSRTMDPTKRSELVGYIQTVLQNRNSLVPINKINEAILPSSKWKLMFSTSDAVLDSLPPDATIFLNILDETNLEYILQFSKKTMGLESLTAKCQYTFDSGPVQPGLLSFVYDKITTNVMGFKNIGVGLFGMLKGRVNYVESAYFDGTFWIERGISSTTGEEFVSVYMRVDE